MVFFHLLVHACIIKYAALHFVILLICNACFCVRCFLFCLFACILIMILPVLHFIFCIHFIFIFAIVFIYIHYIYIYIYALVYCLKCWCFYRIFWLYLQFNISLVYVNIMYYYFSVLYHFVFINFVLLFINYLFIYLFVDVYMCICTQCCYKYV